MPARRIRVIGTVQGVFFRAHAKEQADAFHVRGWVRNESDGSVLLHAEGSEADLDALETWCKRGPPHATIDRIEQRNVPEEGFSDFQIDRR